MVEQTERLVLLMFGMFGGMELTFTNVRHRVQALNYSGSATAAGFQMFCLHLKLSIQVGKCELVERKWQGNIDELVSKSLLRPPRRSILYFVSTYGMWAVSCR